MKKAEEGPDLTLFSAARLAKSVLEFQSELHLCHLSSTLLNTAEQPFKKALSVESERIEHMPQKTAVELKKSVPQEHEVTKQVSSSVMQCASLPLLHEQLRDCQRCKLCATRTHIVFGSGHTSARLVFVGEAPGADEDAQGMPFVGRAGQLLTKMIEAMGLTREQVYICNVIKCRPPHNRDPEPDEIQACEPFLIQQLSLIRPEVIVALGKHATHTLLRETTPISRLRGQWRTYQNIALMPTYHPAYLLRNPTEKKAAWTDLKAVMQRLGLP